MRNVLSVRPQLPGDELREGVEIVCANPLSNSAVQVLLIHGYANSAGRARKSFDRFTHQLRPRLPAATLDGFRTIWEFHWPADEPHWFDPLGLDTLSSYAEFVPVAKRAGCLLADYLGRGDPRQRVHIIAHSLGCRIALQAIRRIRLLGGAYDGAQIGHVFLLAPAVPVRDCYRRTPLAVRPRPAPRFRYSESLPTSSEHVFYSRNDLALRLAPVMQRRAGDRGPAVGIAGFPAGRWATICDTQLGHTRYWRSPEVAQSVAAELAHAPHVLPRRAITEWHVPRRNVARRLIERPPLRRRLLDDCR
jgi:pimeloyl-ACP methyl ester carboxylesterase